MSQTDDTISVTTPLTDEELAILKKKYTQNFDTMGVKSALQLLRMLRGDDQSIFDPYYRGLLLRRLHMIIDWENYPERLI